MNLFQISQKFDIVTMYLKSNLKLDAESWTVDEKVFLGSRIIQNGVENELIIIMDWSIQSNRTVCRCRDDEPIV
jgi:hypothetical protein